MAGAFLARGLDAFEAAAAATFAHAAAGEISALEIGNRDGVIATDVIRAIPRAMIPPAGRCAYHAAGIAARRRSGRQSPTSRAGVFSPTTSWPL